MKRIWLLIGFVAILSAESAAQQFSVEAVPAVMSVRQSPQRLAEVLDSASREAFVPLYAKIYKSDISAADAVISNGDLLWHLKAHNLEIKAYLKLRLARGDTLYIYDRTGNLREIAHAGNHFRGNYLTSFYEDEILIRYHGTSGKEPDVTITHYSIQPKKPSGGGISDFGDADFCEVNVNCEEGQAFRDVAKSVVRIGTKMGGYEGWCTGTLVNNTAADKKPYILSAEHCGSVANSFAAADDLEFWEFYFYYEAESCQSPASESAIDFKKITGAQLVARSDDDGGDYGSDFILLEVTDTTAFHLLANPFFAGWNRANIAPDEGVTIHHPQGDIKKVSTFDGASTASYKNFVQNTHWKVFWVETPNNHGVTEFGSSGCPLLDEDGLITGVLTGGAATCTRPDDPDFFGKFSYSWDENGTQRDRRLEPWLDPINSGVFTLTGSYRDSTQPPILFEDTTDFAIFPNPIGTGTLSVDGLPASDELSTFQIFSLSGNLIYEKDQETVTNKPEEIDISYFTSGVYILRIWYEDQILRKKFIVIN